MAKNEVINVQGTDIQIQNLGGEDYICLTDMCKRFDGGSALIESWLRNRSTLEFLGVWERLNNASFNSPEFEGIKNASGSNSFILSAKAWIEKTNAIGITAKAGRYGGTYAHKDIALEFGSWLSPEFKLYLISEFQRLKQREASEGQLEWNVKRILSKVNYRIHTDAVKTHLIPPLLDNSKQGRIYAIEADVLNKALFGKCAAEWRKENPGRKGNIRDEASIEQLTVLASLESQNALLIEQGIPQLERLRILNKLAIQQMQSILQASSLEALKSKTLLD
ncbi:KilA, N-terminal/APSES-type HTH, DNA-binding protein [Mannheimia sp. USDA-ARS-USMARC-1261]|uniref:KilA-N domain-containing protein n=1 Tax=Mannheimia sp. USDA-ARS-USMARC-1261 TaxID=1432056 RepID=UPI0003E315F3|nr:KilA-N domain-containing protein [Mannheimia sp. USDA-ARS-USMARC-1261]AHG74523.1 KilA, N-terminal/APSES-type HTH, DNA-binding protein [Mannheimia sp. USDA-ARS-USMARC-1261]